MGMKAAQMITAVMAYEAQRRWTPEEICLRHESLMQMMRPLLAQIGALEVLRPLTMYIAEDGAMTIERGILSPTLEYYSFMLHEQIDLMKEACFPSVSFPHSNVNNQEKS